MTKRKPLKIASKKISASTKFRVLKGGRVKFYTGGKGTILKSGRIKISSSGKIKIERGGAGKIVSIGRMRPNWAGVKVSDIKISPTRFTIKSGTFKGIGRVSIPRVKISIPKISTGKIFKTGRTMRTFGKMKLGKKRVYKKRKAVKRKAVKRKVRWHVEPPKFKGRRKKDKARRYSRFQLQTHQIVYTIQADFIVNHRRIRLQRRYGNRGGLSEAEVLRGAKETILQNIEQSGGQLVDIKVIEVFR